MAYRLTGHLTQASSNTIRRAARGVTSKVFATIPRNQLFRHDEPTSFCNFDDSRLPAILRVRKM
ncbi:hypothetical protein [Rhizobium sp. BK418]|uniref:hypothetical protein n=1 Tax=Rhizobium sp. BK418 TaxID=2512120 RepID=UPI001050B309|nr:hypothetical protein EV281_11026 [Rhizobium sp. BK418]